jgi:hypothetical protein
MIDWTLVAWIVGGIGAAARTISAVVKIYADARTIRELNLKIRALEEAQKASEARIHKPTSHELVSLLGEAKYSIYVDNMIITRVVYRLGSATVTIEPVKKDLAEDVVRMRSNLQYEQTTNLPSAYTT